MSRPACPGLIWIGSAGAVGTDPRAGDLRVPPVSAWFLNGALLLPPEVGPRTPQLPVAGDGANGPTVAVPCDSPGGGAADPRTQAGVGPADRASSDAAYGEHHEPVHPRHGHHGLRR